MSSILENMKVDKQTIEELIRMAVEAGDAIMEVYAGNDFDIRSKDDRSPLTLADRRSHEIIQRRLVHRSPSIPVLSEEGKDTEYEQRRNWSRFWLVDPLDGTKEFINRRDEFTVNIALIDIDRPVIGVIYAPALNKLYWASENLGAWRRDPGGDTSLAVNKDFSGGIRVVGSRSHAAKEEEEFYARYRVIEKKSIGSSLKFCLIAEGAADLYYRHGPTYEWDTAAGQCILACAGGHTVTDNEPLKYNKSSLLNGSFTASAVIKRPLEQS